MRGLQGSDHPNAARPFLAMHVLSIADLFWFSLAFQTFTRGLSPRTRSNLGGELKKDNDEIASVATPRMRHRLGALVH